MEAILEIKEILEKFNSREKKAARKYFRQHYSHTKELQLLNFIDKVDEKKRINIENRICKMGYESIHSKSFLKLKSRLKEKLFDYMSSSISINEIRNIDSHSYLKHRLKKMLFQSGVLIEKGLMFQANDLTRTSLRLAQENEQFDLIIESLQKINRISDSQSQDKSLNELQLKVQEFVKIQNNFIETENSFNKLVFKINLESLDHLGEKFIDFLDKSEENQNMMNYERYRIFTEYIKAVSLLNDGRIHDSFEILTKRLKSFRNNSMIFDIRYKILFYTSFVEVLKIAGHSSVAQDFAKHSILKSIPTHLKFNLESRQLHGTIADSNLINFKFPKFVCNDSSSNLIHIYLKCHFLFKSNEFRKCLDMINSNIRAFSIKSVQQIDLMTLELMCHFELENYDLLEYKVQSFLKNLAYRSNLNVPIHYHSIHKIIRLLIRYATGNYNEKLRIVIEDLEDSPKTAFLLNRSFQPALITKWAKKKCNNQKESIVIDLPQNSMTQVA